MKKLFFIFLFGWALQGQAQQDATASSYDKIQHTPSFTIYTVPDSTVFTHQQLKKNMPLVLIFFSPDCEHCQKETKELMANKKELSRLQIVMVSGAPFNLLNNFYKEYKLAYMPNVTMGYDQNHVLSRKYPLRTYPCIFVYDNSGKLAKAFVGNAGVPAILDAVK